MFGGSAYPCWYHQPNIALLASDLRDDFRGGGGRAQLIASVSGGRKIFLKVFFTFSQTNLKNNLREKLWKFKNLHVRLFQILSFKNIWKPTFASPGVKCTATCSLRAVSDDAIPNVHPVMSPAPKPGFAVCTARGQLTPARLRLSPPSCLGH